LLAASLQMILKNRRHLLNNSTITGTHNRRITRSAIRIRGQPWLERDVRDCSPQHETRIRALNPYEKSPRAELSRTPGTLCPASLIRFKLQPFSFPGGSSGSVLMSLSPAERPFANYNVHGSKSYQFATRIRSSRYLARSSEIFNSSTDQINKIDFICNILSVI
jgi:hypothetical protein